MSNQAEIDVAKAINANEALRRVGLDLRRREARNMVDRALYRNSEKRMSNGAWALYEGL